MTPCQFFPPSKKKEKNEDKVEGEELLIEKGKGMSQWNFLHSLY